MIKTLLLLALPASGKSEVRRYLATMSPELRRRDFHLGDLLELDDYPYVHLMRRVDQERARRGAPLLFFQADDRPMLDRRDWGTLIALLDEDYAAVTGGRRPPEGAAGAWLLDRIDAARGAVGMAPAFAGLAAADRGAIASALDPEAKQLAEGLARTAAEWSAAGADRTIVLEFARGGPEGAPIPLAAPHGYAHSIGVLGPAVLEQAAILYIWVTPEESRRKNQARADPNDPGSILHHGVPEVVMRAEYGCDDIDWLVTRSDRPGTARIEAHGKVYHLPIARFDNRVDKTSFLRDDPAAWPEQRVAELHAALAEAFGHLDRAVATRS